MGKIIDAEKHEPFTVWVKDEVRPLWVQKKVVSVCDFGCLIVVQYENGEVESWDHVSLEDPTIPKKVPFEKYSELPNDAVFRWKEDLVFGKCNGMRDNRVVVMAVIVNFANFIELFNKGEMSIDGAETWGPAGKDAV